jgi:hypothetical protein
LEKHGFTESIFLNPGQNNTDAGFERRWLLQKIDDYGRLLDEPMVSQTVRQAIVNEMLINRITRQMLTQNVVGEAFSELQSTKKTIEKTYQEQWAAVNEIVPWANQVGNKQTFAGTLSEIIDAVKEYQSIRSNKKVDGIHTALGVQILLQECVQHGARYRRGQVSAMSEALTTEALFDPNWKRFFTDYQCKQLDVGFKGAVDALRENSNMKLPDLEGEGPNSEYPPLFIGEADEPAESVSLESSNLEAVV